MNINLYNYSLYILQLLLRWHSFLYDINRCVSSYHHGGVRPIVGKSWVAVFDMRDIDDVGNLLFIYDIPSWLPTVTRLTSLVLLYVRMILVLRRRSEAHRFNHLRHYERLYPLMLLLPITRVYRYPINERDRWCCVLEGLIFQLLIIRVIRMRGVFCKRRLIARLEDKLL